MITSASKTILHVITTPDQFLPLLHSKNHGALKEEFRLSAHQQALDWPQYAFLRCCICICLESTPFSCKWFHLASQNAAQTGAKAHATSGPALPSLKRKMTGICRWLGKVLSSECSAQTRKNSISVTGKQTSHPLHSSTGSGHMACVHSKLPCTPVRCLTI